MDSDQLMTWRDFACGLADQARVIAAQYRLDNRAHMNISVKRDRSVVTDADHAIQQRICHAVKNLDAGHAVLCEESADYLREMPSPTNSEFCWVIDPLDGTRNYVRGLPCCCTSIGLLRNGEPIVGVIGDMNSPDTYSAVMGHGVMLNGQPIDQTTDCVSGKPIVSFQPSHQLTELEEIPSWAGSVRMRNFGSSAMHLLYVATGALDGAVCMDCRIWDYAAGYLLVQESGRVMTHNNGELLFPIAMGDEQAGATGFVAARPDLHRSLVENRELSNRV